MFRLLTRALVVAVCLCGLTLPARAATRVLVLPFESPSGHPTLAALGPGTMDSLITAFIRVPEFVMVDRVTIDRVLKEQALQQTGLVDPQSAMRLGKLLGVQAIISGRVQVVGERVRISANFVEAETGRIRKAEQVTGDLTGVFDLQDQLANRFLSDQGVQPTADVARRVTTALKATTNLKAYEVYQQARELYRTASVTGIANSVKRFDEALALDPRYALAYAGKAEALAALGWIREKNYQPAEPVYQEAKAAGDLAIKLQEELPEAHRALSMAQCGLKARADAIRSGERAVLLAPSDAESWMALWFARNTFDPDAPEILKALQLNPQLIVAHLTRGIALGYRMRLTEAMDEGNLAKKLNPDSDSVLFLEGVALSQLGRTAEAIVCLRKAIALNPEFAVAHNFLGEALLAQGKFGEAVSAFEAALALSPEYFQARQNLYHARRRDHPEGVDR